MISAVGAWLLTTFTSLPWLSRALLVVWSLTMISVPILQWIWGPTGRHYGIIAGVLLQAATVISILASAWGLGRTMTTAAIVVVLGWIAEFVGSHTGVPFGRYTYTERLQPQIGRVPAIIPLAWLMMLPPAWAVGASVDSAAPPALTVIVSALAFTAWDLFLDPQMVTWGMWTWAQAGRSRMTYFGIPWSNYAGWFAVSALITEIITPTAVPIAPLLLIYAITWFLEFFGQLFFWHLTGPAIVGGIAMGLCLLSALGDV